ncbi:MAG: disulfide bond formation protein B [Rhodomicrobium sp.]
MLYKTERRGLPSPPLTLENGALIVAALSFLTLAGAWLFQFAGYKPCPLCLEERIPYYAAVAGGALAAYLAGRAPRVTALLLAAACVGLLYNAGLGIYHAGAEWHFWPGPSTCGGDDIQSTSSLAARLRHNDAVRCDEAAVRIFGLSLAGYSVLISAGLALVGAVSIYRDRSWLGRV